MLSSRLRELREEKEMNQDEVAKKINVSRSTYANYESNRAVPSIQTLIDLANLHEVSVDYIVGNTNIKESYYKDPKICNFINRMLLIYKEFFKG
ncbi:MAG: helix-turn-helix transcriptional regulator [Clostridium beijerinckii]|nr:helix-turn-helix transcriptional regulator [Clostridium beijerinckii]